ncbi:MAG: glycogen synthase GlgA [Isosphaeraceae bacterium]|nr:glycogen synthase GlgA [Isosphaeraceae bacterium]
MNVALIASEAVPFAKTGGLADVVGALPRALARHGVAVSVFLPCHRSARDAGIPLRDAGLNLPVPLGSRTLDARIQIGRLPNSTVDVYLIDHPAFFDRDELYGRKGADYGDNSERFVFFQRAVMEAILALGLEPGVLHCNDWQTGLIPVYLDEIYRDRGPFRRAGSLFTIHNIAYQGSFWHWDMPMTGLDWRLFNWRQLEFHGRLNFLKAGLAFADVLSTVSPTYAREIQTPEYGAGFDGLLRARRLDLHGIVNGIDPEVWNPAVDTKIARRYDLASFAEGKAACKAELQAIAGLPVRPDVPLFAQIGRLDPQKGWDLLTGVAESLLDRDVQIVVLGVGQPRYHDLLADLARRRPDKIRCFLEFSDRLSHQIEAAADFFLMPSLYEPCGLNQLYSLAYGTLPIVRTTGGLADTVVAWDETTERSGRANGFAFREASAPALLAAVEQALAIYPDRGKRESMIRAAMSADWSWDRVASAYLPLYDEVVRRQGRSDEIL